MKKIFLALIAACSIAAANAQSHSILLYGNANYSSDDKQYHGYDEKTTTWGVTPGIGYQFSDHCTIGLQGSFGQSITPGITTLVFYPSNFATVLNKVTVNDWTAGAFFRYTKYFGKRFFVYGQLDAGYAAGSLMVDGIPPNGTYTGFSGMVYPGVGVFIAKGFAINFSMGGLAYSAANWTNNYDGLQYENKFNITFGNTYNLGISKNFQCRHHAHGHHEMGEDTRHIDTSDDEEDAPKKARHRKHKKKDTDDTGDE